jgi:hypothetical protein
LEKRRSHPSKANLQQINTAVDLVVIVNIHLHEELEQQTFKKVAKELELLVPILKRIRMSNSDNPTLLVNISITGALERSWKKTTRKQFITDILTNISKTTSANQDNKFLANREQNTSQAQSREGTEGRKKWVQTPAQKPQNKR